MSPFRKGSELRSVADSKVFIDLGVMDLPEDTCASTIHIMRPNGEKDLRHIRKHVLSGSSLILDMSDYSGDADLAEKVILDATRSVGIAPIRVGVDSWLLASKGLIVEHHGKV
ncbi:MAG: hypothetical protein IKC93_04695 [Candidatus Methanomethylophilaceae archaeon]|nr:hypothetical protein [Candidatus Methanomethylophilaceae archaeon]